MPQQIEEQEESSTPTPTLQSNAPHSQLPFQQITTTRTTTPTAATVETQSTICGMIPTLISSTSVNSVKPSTPVATTAVWPRTIEAFQTPRNVDVCISPNNRNDDILTNIKKSNERLRHKLAKIPPLPKLATLMSSCETSTSITSPIVTSTSTTTTTTTTVTHPITDKVTSTSNQWSRYKNCSPRRKSFGGGSFYCYSCANKDICGCYRPIIHINQNNNICRSNDNKSNKIPIPPYKSRYCMGACGKCTADLGKTTVTPFVASKSNDELTTHHKHHHSYHDQPSVKEQLPNRLIKDKSGRENSNSTEIANHFDVRQKHGCHHKCLKTYCHQHDYALSDKTEPLPWLQQHLVLNQTICTSSENPQHPVQSTELTGQAGTEATPTTTIETKQSSEDQQQTSCGRQQAHSTIMSLSPQCYFEELLRRQDSAGCAKRCKPIVQLVDTHMHCLRKPRPPVKVDVNVRLVPKISTTTIRNQLSGAKSEEFSDNLKLKGTETTKSEDGQTEAVDFDVNETLQSTQL